MIFVNLLVVEVNHLEIVIGRLGEAPGGGFARYALKKICFWAINGGNDKKENTATFRAYWPALWGKT